MDTLPPRWSWSKLSLYRKCPLAARFKYLDRIPEPPRPTDDKGAERGLRIHKGMELYLLEGAPLPIEAAKFEEQAGALRDMAPAVEKKMFFDSCWKPCDEEDHWLIVIQDASVNQPGEFALSVDFKTGKRFGNEAAHMGQKTIYSIANWLTDPACDSYTSEMWYIDQADIWSTTFTAEQLAHWRAKFDDEVDRMLNDRIFRPRANTHSCRFCPYSPRGNGHCPVGV
jgi:hypothetical protein